MIEAKPKSLKFNMFLNSVRTITGIVFPLISFPYVSNILGVDALGRYNFAASIISYILLLAGLGIETYAVREGARVRDDTQKLSKFANEIFSVNVLSTVFSFAVLIILICFFQKLYDNRFLLLILSMQVLFNVIGINWVYSVYEEYTCPTICSIFFQALSLVLMFVFIKNPEDIEIYALITVFSSICTNIFNYFYAKRKYFKLKLTLKINWKQHIKPIMILFAMATAVTIYVNSDITMLGFMCDDYTVGIYSVAVKIYTICKMLFSSVIVVSIPRLSALAGENKQDEFCDVADNIFSMLLTVLLPGIVGMIALSEPIIILISNEAFISAEISLILLSLALFFCLGAGFYAQALLVPLKKEKVVLKATVTSAIVNIILNLCLIPFGHEKAAALTTLIAEAIAFIMCYLEGRKYVKMKDPIKLTLKILIGCISIFIIAYKLKSLISSRIIYTILTVIFSVIIYTALEILLKNKTVLDVFSATKKLFGYTKS